MEMAEPGVIRNATDIFGNNALWYGLHLLGSNECEPATKQLGCDPAEPNNLGLTYNSIIEVRSVLNDTSSPHLF